MLSPRFLLGRRRLLKVASASVVGTTLPFTALQTIAGPSRANAGAKSVLLVLLSGGPSQLDMWDPKPDAPAEIRGEFKAINTAVPGISICEHMPQLASRIGQPMLR